MCDFLFALCCIEIRSLFKIDWKSYRSKIQIIQCHALISNHNLLAFEHCAVSTTSTSLCDWEWKLCSMFMLLIEVMQTLSFFSSTEDLQLVSFLIVVIVFLYTALKLMCPQKKYGIIDVCREICNNMNDNNE